MHDDIVNSIIHTKIVNGLTIVLKRCTITAHPHRMLPTRKSSAERVRFIWLYRLAEQAILIRPQNSKDYSIVKESWDLIRRIRVIRYDSAESRRCWNVPGQRRLAWDTLYGGICPIKSSRRRARGDLHGPGWKVEHGRIAPWWCNTKQLSDRSVLRCASLRLTPTLERAKRPFPPSLPECRAALRITRFAVT